MTRPEKVLLPKDLLGVSRLEHRGWQRPDGSVAALLCERPDCKCGGGESYLRQGWTPLYRVVLDRAE